MIKNTVSKIQKIGRIKIGTKRKKIISTKNIKFRLAIASGSSWIIPDNINDRRFFTLNVPEKRG